MAFLLFVVPFIAFKCTKKFAYLKIEGIVVAHSGKIAGAAESTAGLHSSVRRVLFGQMRRGEHVLDRPQPFQDGTAVYLFPFSLELDGAGSIVAAGDGRRVWYIVVEIPHRHDARYSCGLERVHQALQPQHRSLPARPGAFSHLGWMVVHQHRQPLFALSEYGEEDIPRGHDGAGAVVEGAGLGRFEAESALAVEQRTVDSPVVGGIVMHYGIIEFIELSIGNQGLKDGTVAHFRKGHNIRQAAVGVCR